ncbi:MAG TPA: DUF3159 domain-containing protein [Actinomycetes bacterium]|nr:DUF3159 domain-containing protein [Actinomycetes bacterium]
MTSDPPEELQEKDLLHALGGKQGLADGGLPGAVFVTVYVVSGQNLGPALWSALGVAAILTVIRLLRRSSVQFALMGMAGVGISALIAWATGRAINFFILGLCLQALFVVMYFVSIRVRRPLIGVIVGQLLGDGMAWKDDPARVSAYTKATWLWCGMFAFRLAVQLPLFIMDKPVALGYVKLAMGWPLLAVVAWLTYRLIRVAPTAEATSAD